MAAATNSDGEYPWGSAAPNDELMNYEHNVGACSPVGVYPAGAAPGGFLDMAGNVWEWTDEEIGGLRVIRGGGWAGDAQFCRSAFRGHLVVPRFRRRFLGFRLSRSKDKDEL